MLGKAKKQQRGGRPRCGQLSSIEQNGVRVLEPKPYRYLHLYLDRLAIQPRRLILPVSKRFQSGGAKHCGSRHHVRPNNVTRLVDRGFDHHVALNSAGTRGRRIDRRYGINQPWRLHVAADFDGAFRLHRRHREGRCVRPSDTGERTRPRGCRGRIEHGRLISLPFIPSRRSCGTRSERRRHHVRSHTRS